MRPVSLYRKLTSRIKLTWCLSRSSNIGNSLLLVSCTAIWRYTIYWSLLLTGLAFFLCGTCACLIFSRRSRKHFKYAIWLPVGYCFLGGIISLVTGTVIGKLTHLRSYVSMEKSHKLTCILLKASLWVGFRVSRLGRRRLTLAASSAGAYNAAYLRMSTWVPFLWSAAQTLGMPILFKSPRSPATADNASFISILLVVVIGSYSTITFLL